MKNKLIGFVCGVVALSSTPVKADLEVCKDLASFAEKTMMLRQAGVPLADVLSIDVGDLQDFSRKVALQAYSYPAYGGEQMKQHTITEFGNMYLIACLEATDF